MTQSKIKLSRWQQNILNRLNRGETLQLKDKCWRFSDRTVSPALVQKLQKLGFIKLVWRENGLYIERTNSHE
jgi:hypothetical protein